MIVTNTVSTGAFEVYLNDTLVFSKIQKYRYPTEEVLLYLNELFPGVGASRCGICEEGVLSLFSTRMFIPD